MHHKSTTAQSNRELLIKHAARLSTVRTTNLFEADPDRFDRFSRSLDGLFIDFSKNQIDSDVLATLVDLASGVGLEAWRDEMFEGGIVNPSENRPALHVALRDPNGPPLVVDGVDIRKAVGDSLSQLTGIVERLRENQWMGATDKPITDVIHIGIGGSILGPATAVHALGSRDETGPTIHFVSNVDAAALMPVLRDLNPETTLVVVVSKSFTTLETLTNGQTARQWLLDALPEKHLHRHLIAVTARPDRAHQFGVSEDNILAFWPWVGGRFSLWSAVGLPIALSAGMERFNRFLDGARVMDEHFKSAQLDENIPVLLALMSIWNANYQGISAHTILPYDDRLDGLPAHIQQLEMESTGKNVDRGGHPLEWHTAPIIFGMSGTDAQHTFFQAVHQGTRAVSADFIGCLRNDHGGGLHHEQLLANLFAQSEALMLGWSAPDDEGHEERVCPGNRPSTTILLESLNPENLGMLLALYEHKVFVQSVVWGINPFDQWGVELGKQLAGSIMDDIAAGEPVSSHDSSTNGLINRFLKSRQEP
jgi:glucose-6-phosphate isomerase